MTMQDAVQVSVQKNSALPAVFSLLGDKSALGILAVLEAGPQRFTAIHDALGGSTKTTSSRLKILEEQGFLTRTMYAEIPPRTVYGLTQKGEEFLDLLRGIAEWDVAWANISTEN